MKKILSVFALVLLTTLSYSQSSTPRQGNTSGSEKPSGNTVSVQLLTDGVLTTDTVLIAPKASLNQYWINTGDTLKGTFCIALKDTTVRGRANIFSTDNFCYAGDKMEIYFKTTGLKTDTINFYGAIVTDTLGTATNKRIVIRKDLTKTSYKLTFVFDGTNYVQETYGMQGLFIGRP